MKEARAKAITLIGAALLLTVCSTESGMGGNVSPESKRVLSAGDTFTEEANEAFDDADYRAVYTNNLPLAEAGDPAAQLILGLLYMRGLGVAQDYAETARWLRKAADQGLADAQLNLGWMYANGKGVAKDFTTAANWYRKSAEQESAEGQIRLGDMYYYGIGVPQDIAEYLKWYGMAAEQGNMTARGMLGMAYWRGRIVPQDLVKAYIAFSSVEFRDEDRKAQTLEKIAADMSPADLERARRAARECATRSYEGCF